MNILKMTLISLVLLNMAYAQEAPFDGTTPLTPEEEAQAGDYIHQGLADRETQEKCNPENREKDEYKDLCTGTYGAKGETGQLIEAMVPAVTKVYATVLGMSGAGGKIKMQNKADGKSAEDKSDWCKWIPVAGEAVNIGFTTLQNTNTQNNYNEAKPAARQKASFEALAKTHKDQKTASHMQMGVYGGTAACYGSMLFGKTVVPTKQSRNMIIAKIGGSALIATFYGLKAKAHKERAELLTELANDLPGAGDCNPFTETTCFCNEESSFTHDPANFQKFCVPEPFVARNNNNDAYVCADSNGRADPDCSCDASNSCIDRVIKAGAIDFGISPTMMRDPLASLRPMSKGFGTGNMSGANGRNRALANKVMKNFKPDRPINLNSAQKKLAKTYNKLGIPKAVAAVMAERSSGSGGGGAVPASLAGIGGDSDLASRMGIKSFKKPMNNKFVSGGSTKKRSRRSTNPFGRLKKRGGAKGGIEIDGKYASRATRAAEIHNNSDVSIFRVISNRYQRTGWKQFPEAFDVEKK